MPPPVASTDAIASYLNKRLDSLLERPRMWASSRESLEAQFLQLVEALAFVLRPDITAAHLNRLRRKHVESLGTGHPLTTLFHLLIPDGEDDEKFSKLAEELDRLRAHLDEHLATAPFVEAPIAPPTSPSA